MTAAVATTADLLVELFTEELPPRALRKLGDAFRDAIVEGLRARGLAHAECGFEGYASPRRLAVRVEGVRSVGADRTVEVKGPSVKVGLDAEGQPTQALLKWAERQGADVASLSRASDGKQEVFIHRATLAGEQLDAAMSAVVEQALAKLPIPKLMTYQLADGQATVSFVRPAHGLVVLHGERVVPASVLGLQSGRTTHGHRFLGARDIELAHADDYAQRLEADGKVIASFEQRREHIRGLLAERAARLGAHFSPPHVDGERAPGYKLELELDADHGALLDEVTALVEWPTLYVGRFDAAFLAVPQECLILTMRTNQKYFPLFDTHGKLRPEFLIVSNMQVADPAAIVDGNERVVRPRLDDARFFYEQDLKVSLDTRADSLASVVYHQKLGSQLDRVNRIERIAAAVVAMLADAPGALRADAARTARAARLAKADLVTGMVGEFPELQGVMGHYYARAAGEPDVVAQAIEEHYRPRFAGDALPATAEGTVLALADKLETLAGIWGIGLVPTGDKDPFALRRHALGVVRMLVDKAMPLDLHALLAAAFAAFDGVATVPAAGEARDKAVAALNEFVVERLRGWLRERFDAPVIDAALAVDARRLDRLVARLEAVVAFRALPEAEALAAANKRIGNILRKSAPQLLGTAQSVDAQRLVEPAERALAEAIDAIAPETEAKLAGGDYAGALARLAGLRAPVDAFFDGVMVNAEDEALRANRLALLANLHARMNGVADLARLAA